MILNKIFPSKILGASNGIPYTKALEMYIFISSVPVTVRELGTRAGDGRGRHCLNLPVRSRGQHSLLGTIHSTNIYHMSSGSDGALRIKNEYTLTLYTN